MDDWRSWYAWWPVRLTHTKQVTSVPYQPGIIYSGPHPTRPLRWLCWLERRGDNEYRPTRA